MTEIITHSAAETVDFAKQLALKLHNGDVLAYRGGMGAGKTAFTRGLALGLGLGDVVSSPTFALVNEYRGKGTTLYHFDMYRIDGYDDLYSTGFFDYLNSDGILAVEWSENITEDLPDNTITVTITPLDETTRKIKVEGGNRF